VSRSNAAAHRAAEEASGTCKVDKDTRPMKNGERFRLATKNKEEGNAVFAAGNYSDALAWYSRALSHLSKMTTSNVKAGNGEVAAEGSDDDEVEEDNACSKNPVVAAEDLKVSCLLNTSQCYVKLAQVADEEAKRSDDDGGETRSGRDDAGRELWKKAVAAADDVVAIRPDHHKALYRKAFALVALGELQSARKGDFGY
jgi:tetratricopeptide (TPR) repeat protein